MPYLVDRSTLRSLRRSPGFTTMAVLSLALAVGLTTTTFGVVDAVRHPYVPYREPERLFSITPRSMDRNGPSHSADMYRALRNQTGFYQAIAAWSLNRGNVVVRGAPVAWFSGSISTNYFKVMGVKPYLGRDFRPADGNPGADPVAIVDYTFWQTSMARSKVLSNTPVTIEGTTYTVVGVMPPSMGNGGSIWLPMPHAMEERSDSDHYAETIVRLKPKVTRAQMEAQLRLLAGALAKKYRADATSRIEYQVYDVLTHPGVLTTFDVALASAAFIVLLISCADVANLLVARMITKRREIAVRMALGASRADLARYVLGEAIVLALAGGMVGVLLAVWGTHLAEYRLTTRINALGTLTPHLSWRVCLFAFLVTSSITGLIAWGAIRRARSTEVNEVIKDGSGSTTHRRGGIYRGLVVLETALSLVVLMGAALCLRATNAMGQFQFGYDARHVLLVTARRWDNTTIKGDSLDRLFTGLVAGVRTVPGVRAVAVIAGNRPKGGLLTSDAGGVAPPQLNAFTYQIASSEYLSTLGIPIIEGRDLQPGDSGVVIVDDSSARRLWPGQSAVGHMLKLGDINSDGAWVRVVGVARSVRTFDVNDPDAPPPHGIYVAQPGTGPAFRSLVIRTTSNDAAVQFALSRYFQTELHGVFWQMYPWLSSFDGEIQVRQFLSVVFVLIAAFALGLSTVGLYSVLAYTGAQRTREYATRIALGARSPDIMRLVLREAFLVVIGGTAAGAFVAMWGGKILSHWLYNVDPMDPIALVSAEGVLLLISLLAALGPAIRATRANPVEMLRAT